MSLHTFQSCDTFGVAKKASFFEGFIDIQFQVDHESLLCAMHGSPLLGVFASITIVSDIFPLGLIKCTTFINIFINPTLFCIALHSHYLPTTFSMPIINVGGIWDILYIEYNGYFGKYQVKNNGGDL